MAAEHSGMPRTARMHMPSHPPNQSPRVEPPSRGDTPSDARAMGAVALLDALHSASFRRLLADQGCKFSSSPLKFPLYRNRHQRRFMPWTLAHTTARGSLPPRG